MYGRINYSQEKIIINNYILSGVQSIDLTSQFSITPINILGYGNLTSVSQKMPVSNFNINRYIVGEDPLYNMFFNIPAISGVCIYKDKYFSFSSNTQMNSYSMNCSVNELVNSNVSFLIYGDIITGQATPSFLTNIDNTNSGLAIPLQIPTYQSVIIELDEPLFDRIISFDYTVNIDKQPIYGIGSIYPLDYYINYPIEQKITLTVEIDESSIQSIQDKICNQFTQNIDIYITTKCQESTIMHLSFPECVLTNQNFKGAISDNRVVTQLEFKRWINDETTDPMISEHISYYRMTGYALPTISAPILSTYYMSPYTGYLN